MARNKVIQHLLAEFLPNAQAIEYREPARSSRFTLYTLVALVITAIVWATFSEIDKLVIGTGKLITPLPNLVVQPLEPGILKSIDVRVGQVVKKGAVLATLDPTFASADANQLGSRSQTLSLQAERLESELRGETQVNKPGDNTQKQLQSSLLAERQAGFAARIKQFDETIQRLRASLETNKQDQKSLERRLQTLRELESMNVKLETQKYVSPAQRLETEDKRLEVERDYHLAVNQEKEIQREIAATEAERTTFDKSWRQKAMEELTTTLQQRRETDDQLAKARLRSTLVTLTAPDDAIVLEIGNKSVGSILKDAEPLFTLVLANAELEVEIEISPSDVAEIRTEDDVRVKIDAYPFQKHGTITAKVTNISADTFSRSNSVGGQQFYYLVRANLVDTKLNQMVDPPRLLPGMTITGEIMTGKRSVISYFLYPVMRIFDESLRER